MATPIMMPKAGNSVEECLLTTWRVKPGDTVKSGDVVADIETDKAAFEIESPAAGTVLAVFWSEGDLVPVMQNLCVVGAPGEDAAPFRPEGAAAPAAGYPVAPRRRRDPPRRRARGLLRRRWPWPGAETGRSEWR